MRNSFQTRATQLRVRFSLILLVALVAGLIPYKGYSGLSKLQQVRASGTLELRDDIQHTALASAKFDFLARSVEYLHIVWPALLFGVLISAWVQAFVPATWLARTLGKSATRQQVTAAVVGTPLMLCSCCASPLFSATYERSKRLSPSLALMLASPGMNPAALALCFMLFPIRIAGARVAMTLVAVLLASRLPELLLPDMRSPNHSVVNTRLDEPKPKTLGLPELLATYLRSCWHVTIRTIPPIVLGILGAMLIPGRLLGLVSSVGGGVVLIALVALFAVLLALPSFFEIPLAFSVLAAGAPLGAAGAPLGAAAAVLFAGPIINLPSLLVVGRYVGWKVSALFGILSVGNRVFRWDRIALARRRARRASREGKSVARSSEHGRELS